MIPSAAGEISAADMEDLPSEGQRRKADRSDSPLGFAWFLLKLVIAVLIVRSFIIAPFSIPSQSMLPRLSTGDYLIASKWSYGYSRYSLPFNVSLIGGRVFASQPDRGDIVIFKHPVDEQDYVKRVIGLPGDTVAMRGGQIILNGDPIPQRKLADLAIPLGSGAGCASGRWADDTGLGTPVCLYQRKMETLPGGRSFKIIDIDRTPQDDFSQITVPGGSVFVLGDNRDRSLDSRFPAQAGLGVGLVPQANLVARARLIFWSSDGSAQWFKPWTWISSARFERVGTVL